jgi:hypothetical protein
MIGFGWKNGENRRRENTTNGYWGSAFDDFQKKVKWKSVV